VDYAVRGKGKANAPLPKKGEAQSISLGQGR
jgi:hypothetical protein